MTLESGMITALLSLLTVLAGKWLLTPAEKKEALRTEAEQDSIAYLDELRAKKQRLKEEALRDKIRKEEIEKNARRKDADNPPKS